MPESLGICQIGYTAVGWIRIPEFAVYMDADIVVFDPDTIAPVGTYEDPNYPAVGVQSVIVNGVAVVGGGELLVDAAPGQPIRRAVKVD